MLKSVINLFVCPCCLPEEVALETFIFEETSDRIHNGVLQCSKCKSIFPIEDDLLELVPPALLDTKDVTSFYERFKTKIRESRMVFPLPTSVSEKDAGFAPQFEQREHFDWYADNTSQNYQAYQSTPFWKAVDQVTFRRWNRMIPDGSIVLDIGCADGRSAFQLIKENRTVLGFDVSKKMIRNAIQIAEQKGLRSSTTFFVSDGNVIPFRSGSLDTVTSYGVLHHLPHPDVTLKSIYRILKKEGLFLTSENNKSFVRPVFDFIMKIIPLWTELAGTEPLISRKMIQDWTQDMNAEKKIYTTVFLPPHMFNLAGESLSHLLLRYSDGISKVIPFWKNNGGLIILEMKKK